MAINRAQATGFILSAIIIAAVAAYLLIGTQTGFKSEGQATMTGGSTTPKECCQCQYSYRSSGVTLRTEYYSGQECSNGDGSSCKCLSDAEMKVRDVTPLANEPWRLINPAACVKQAESVTSCPDNTPPPVTTPPPTPPPAPSDKAYCLCTYNCGAYSGSATPIQTTMCGQNGANCEPAPTASVCPAKKLSTDGRKMCSLRTPSKYSGAAC